MRNIHEKIVFAVLVLLALNNLIFFIIGSYSGSVWGFFFAVVITVHWWRRRDGRVVMVLAVIWIVIHIYELTVLGAGPYPVLFYLNLVLPIALFCFSLKAYLFVRTKTEGER
jgi:hypothetical protein